MLDLWNIHHKCCATQMLEPLYTLYPFRNPLELQESQGFVNKALTSTLFTHPALHLSAREGCPGHCDTLFTGRISSRLVRPSSYLIAASSFQAEENSVQSASQTSLAS